MAQIYNITLDQYANYQLVLTWNDSNGNPVNLTGYTCKFEMQPVNGTTLTDWSSYVTLGGAAGTVTIDLPASVTSSFSAPPVGTYDITLTSGGGIVTRLIQGIVTASPGISH